MANSNAGEKTPETQVAIVLQDTMTIGQTPQLHYYVVEVFDQFTWADPGDKDDNQKVHAFDKL